MQPAASAALPLSEDEVVAWRERFPILRRCTYLINNSLGAMPAGVSSSLGAFAAAWAIEGVEAWSTTWLPEVRRVADVLASLIGAPPGSVVLQQNVAALTSVVWGGVPFSAPRDRVVMTTAEWPGHRYLAGRWAERGVDVELVPAGPFGADLELLLEAVDERTALVVASHVVYTSSAIADVAAVAARCREVGALSLVDGYHATGHLPVDVERIGCDLYVGGSVKWLCGGPGVGYLYVRPGLAAPAWSPTAVGWLGHARPFAFEDAWEAGEGAFGWLGGTPSIPAVYAARQGYAAIAEVGPSRVRATSVPLTQRLVEGALERGASVRSPRDPAARAGAVAIDVGDGTEALSRRLIASGILVDHRPGAGIRVGPHFFSTAEEIDRFLAALAHEGPAPATRRSRAP